jgi:hypothetical protein
MSVVENAINDAVDYFMENPSNAFPSGLPSQTDVRLVLNDLVGEEGYGRASQSASVKKVMALLKKHSKNLLMENPRRRMPSKYRMAGLSTNIEALRANVQYLQSEIKSRDEGIRRLVTYLQSPKFRDFRPGYDSVVEVKDVLRYIQEIYR